MSQLHPAQPKLDSMATGGSGQRAAAAVAGRRHVFRPQLPLLQIAYPTLQTTSAML